MNAYQILARQLAGVPVDMAIIDALPEPTRSIGQRVAAANGDGELAAFESALSEILPTVGEREQCRAAVFAADPLAESGEPLADAAGQSYAEQAKDLADALAPRPRLPGVVAGVLGPRSLSIWYGSPGSLKSNLLFDLCLAVATGSSWLPDLPDEGNGAGYNVTQSPVLWVDIDGGEDVTAERLAAFARAYGAPEDTPLYWLTFPTPPLVAARGLPGLTAYALSIGAGLIVIDNLLRVAGVRDENSSEIDSAMAHLRKLAEATGAAVAVIHHRRKDTLGREGDSLRGHSSIEGAIDAAFLVKRVEMADEVTVKSTKARRRPVPTFGARWTYELADDGQTLRTARFWRAGIQDSEAEKESALRSLILRTLGAAEMNKSAIREKTGGAREMVYALLEEMAAAGELSSRRGDKNATLYRVKGG